MQASKRLPFSFATRLDSSVDQFNPTSGPKKTTVQNVTLIALMRRASETRKDRTCPWRLCLSRGSDLPAIRERYEFPQNLYTPIAPHTLGNCGIDLSPYALKSALKYSS